MHRSLMLGAFSLAVASAWGCGEHSSGFMATDAAAEATGDSGSTDASILPRLGDSAVGGPPYPCKNLECREVACAASEQTTISGTVFAPSTVAPDPIYDAIVYIPNDPLEPFSKGVSCDHCGATVSGSPIAVALTGPDGHFSIKNAPVGDNIPIVVQVGRWRRLVTIPHVAACAVTELSPEQTRLPRNQTEGDIPHMAIATGLLDPMECLLRKIGIDDSEFTTPDDDGRVHIYVQNGMNLSPPGPAASDLWSNITTLENYDLLLLPCEGQPNLKPASATQNLIDYTSVGGRVFATHYSYVWIYDAQAPFPSTAAWDVNQEPFPPDPLAGFVDTSFPKGRAMAEWLGVVHASTSYGQISISEPREDVDSVKTPPSQGWINSLSPASAQHFTFETPVGAGDAEQCGKVVFSDFHVVSGETTGLLFPEDCVDGPLSPQEKVLEFMFFDLASCVQNDADPPKPPPIK